MRNFSESQDFSGLLVEVGLGWRPKTKYTDIGAFATQRNTPLCETSVCVKSVTSVTRELPDTSDRLTRARNW